LCHGGHQVQSANGPPVIVKFVAHWLSRRVYTRHGATCMNQSFIAVHQVSATVHSLWLANNLLA
jgi:hypothetical protein